MREGKWKFHLGMGRNIDELYDLSLDPSEANNLASTKPDIVLTMKKKIRAWVAELPR